MPFLFFITVTSFIFTEKMASRSLPILSVFVFLCWFSGFNQSLLPKDFNDYLISDELVFPMGMTFDGKGRMFVWDKLGKVFLFDKDGNLTPQPIIDISGEVASFHDHGLMCMALDRDFLQNGYIYLLYAVDLHYDEFYGTAKYHRDSTVINHPTFGRVTRYTVAFEQENQLRAISDSRHVLLGESKAEGIPLLNAFHGLGTITVGTDGTLLISVGDAASGKGPDMGGTQYNPMIEEALANGIIAEDEDIGSYRSQYLGSYNGKILRIHPETGQGLSSNPFFDPEAPYSPPSKVWAYGLRNPYRITVKPESGSHYPEDGNPGILMVGDVGTGLWEELNLVQVGGQNFGWPLTEGYEVKAGFFGEPSPMNRLAPNVSFGSESCSSAFYHFTELAKLPLPSGRPVFDHPCVPGAFIEEEVHPSVISLPELSWSNSRWNPPSKTVSLAFNDQKDPYGFPVGLPESTIESDTFAGYSSLAGAFYTGDQFPESYHGKYFAFDHIGWIKVFTFDDNLNLTAVEPFHVDAEDPIHVAINPVNGNLYYVNTHKEIRCVQYKGIVPPKAVIESDVNYGVSPLTVTFSGEKSTSLNGPIQDYFWDFGDGDTSHLVNPSHIFDTPNTLPVGYEVTLVVTDSAGGQGKTKVPIAINNTPPTTTIKSVQDQGLYPIDKTNLLELEAQTADAESTIEELDFEWEIFLHHNDHFHPEPPIHSEKASTLISPLGCVDNEWYWYRIKLTVTDPQGLSATDELTIYPNCDPLFVDWKGLNLAVLEEGITITWEATAFDATTTYEVQRSTDYLNFSTIARQAGLKDGQGQFFDASPHIGTNIYRIKATLPNGAFTYTNLEAADFPPLSPVRIFPNPAQQFLQLSVQHPSPALFFRLINPAGQVVLERNFEANSDEAFETSISLLHLPNGVYYYILEQGEMQYKGSLLVGK